MSSPTPREVTLDFFADLNAGKQEEAFARLAPEVVYRIVAPDPYGGAVNAAGLLEKAGALFEKFAEPFIINIQTVICEDEHVVLEAQGKALTKRGGDYVNNYVFIFRVVDGLIVEAKEYLDTAAYIALLEDQI
ncbi:nuclear transport factor 2 family protein [Parasphingorhabdus sp.]|jgi:uncharacterized protein